tara:strand:- start:247 stop:474 length:228 start_codon:yes stop_codon:yes gene_type:complete
MFKLNLLLVLILFPNISYAYLGPGMGGGFIAATIGIIIAIFAMIFGILWFPIKRFFNKNKKDQEESSKNNLDNKE